MMDNDNLATLKDILVLLVPSIVTVLTLYFTMHQRRKDGQSDIELANKSAQLDHIFTPIEKLLQKSGYQYKKVKKIDKAANEKNLAYLKAELTPIITNAKDHHFLLLPTNLTDAFYQTDEKIPLQRFLNIHDTYYNWLKKELKYPYENGKINRAYIMDHSISLSAYDIGKSIKTVLIAVFLWFSSAIALFLLFILTHNFLSFFFNVPQIDPSSTWWQVIVLVSLIIPFPLFIKMLNKP